MSEEFADGSVETPNEEINWEERAKKAEAKIVDLKKTPKEVETPKEAEVFDESSVKEILARERFLDKNPEIRDFEEDFIKFTSSWLTEAQAKSAILASNPEIVNREKTNSMGINGTPPSPDKTVFTEEEFLHIAKNDQQSYNSLIARKQKGEIRITK